MIDVHSVSVAPVEVITLLYNKSKELQEVNLDFFGKNFVLYRQKAAEALDKFLFWKGTMIRQLQRAP